jgi:bifunctional oligoribonuclease and PAP phosphatase NrnA
MTAKYKEAQAIDKIIKDAKHIVIIQADNPDGDSLASSLAMEQILHEMGKEPYMYCGVDMPSYLHYLPGWDRVNREFPNTFDASIIVDCSAKSLMETADKRGHLSWIASKPSVVLDHHLTDATIDFATIMCNQKAVSTGEVIYELAKDLQWPLNIHAKNMIAISILSDSLGLTTEAVTGRSIHIVGELVDDGVALSKIDEARREMMRKSPELVKYKGELLQRIEYSSNDRIATITIPWDEIEKYSHAYNPTMLVMDDMRLTEKTDVAIGFKVYKDNRVTAKVRCNLNKGIANKLAEHFGGGGHQYASGFKITSGKPFNEIKAECIQVATELLDNLDKEKADEAI